MLLEIRRISREKEREMYGNAAESKAVCHCSMENDTQNESEQGESIQMKKEIVSNDCLFYVRET